jgi:hydrogenase expression/formation protein HypC
MHYINACCNNFKKKIMCLAIPGKIISIESKQEEVFRTGKVSFGGIIKEVNLSMVPDVKIGDYVLVHVGVVISKVDEEEAMHILQYLEQMGEMDELDTAETNSITQSDN